jgi:hypothetical protein
MGAGRTRSSGSSFSGGGMRSGGGGGREKIMTVIFIKDINKEKRLHKSNFLHSRF